MLLWVSCTSPLEKYWDIDTSAYIDCIWHVHIFGTISNQPQISKPLMYIYWLKEVMQTTWAKQIMERQVFQWLASLLTSQVVSLWKQWMKVGLTQSLKVVTKDHCLNRTSDVWEEAGVNSLFGVVKWSGFQLNWICFKFVSFQPQSHWVWALYDVLVAISYFHYGSFLLLAFWIVVVLILDEQLVSNLQRGKRVHRQVEWFQQANVAFLLIAFP